MLVATSCSTALAGGPFVVVAKDAKAYTVAITVQKTFVTNPIGLLFPETKPHSVTRENYGAGFVVSSEGHILTCNHVIDCAERITVKWSNGVSKEAVIDRSDPKTDIAILKVEHDKPLAKADLRTTTLAQVGEDVMAFGYPQRGSLSATRGIVSRLNCQIAGKDIDGGQSEGHEGLVQIDAPINGGNSGGPVFDTDGRVIGMVSLISTDQAGVAYIVPSPVLAHRYLSMRAEPR